MQFIKTSALTLMLAFFSISSYAICPLLDDDKTLLVTTSQDGLFADECSLREAVKEANQTEGHSFINFHPSTNNQVFYINSQLEITEALTINGNGPLKTIIDAQHQSRIFYTKISPDLFDYKDRKFSLNSIALRNGFVHADLDVENDENDTPLGGGAILVGTNNYFTLTKSVITGSVAIPVVKDDEPLYAAGGAIELRPQADAEIKDSTLAYNAALKGSAIMIPKSSFANQGSLGISKSLITNNLVTDIVANKIEDNIFEYKNSGNYNISAAIDSDGILGIFNSTIINNSNPSGSGAGIVFSDRALDINPTQSIALKIYFSTIANNYAHYKNRPNTAGLVGYFTYMPFGPEPIAGHHGVDITNSIFAGNYTTIDQYTPPDVEVFNDGGSYQPESMGVEPFLNVVGIQKKNGLELFLEEKNNKIGDKNSPKTPKFDAFELYNTDSHLIGHLPLSINDTLAVDNNDDCHHEYVPEEIFKFDQKGVERGMICDAGASELEN